MGQVAGGGLPAPRHAALGPAGPVPSHPISILSSDGSGYPDGLRGEEIPLAARIFAAVDVWEALSSDRPYRDARSRDAILAYMRTNAGTAFDPAILEVFLDRVVPEL